MALISIQGVDLPTPSEFSVGTMDISKAERNALGRMIIERITTKKKLNLTYAYLTASEAKFILNIIAPTYYTVTYPEPQTGTMVTGTFYCGDRNIGMVDYINGQTRYKELAFNLIEL